jgi:hypothetical protein
LASASARVVPVADRVAPGPRVLCDVTVDESDSSAAATPAACGPANDRPSTNAAAPTQAPRLFIGMKVDRLRCSREITGPVVEIELTYHGILALESPFLRLLFGYAQPNGRSDDETEPLLPPRLSRPIGDRGDWTT